jgi:hypothetical protein
MRTRMRAIVLVCIVVISAVPLTAAQTSPECGPPSVDPDFWVPFDPPGPEPIPFLKVSLELGTVKPVPMPEYRPMPMEPEKPEPTPSGSTMVPRLGPAEPPDLCNNPRVGD